MQIEAFKKKNSFAQNYLEKIKELQDSKNILEAELEKSKKYFGEQEEELEEALSKLKEKNKILQKDILNEKETLY